ncbi:MAG: GNAT family N-acetyltransferase [Ruminococcaceae bacterium]|nr:GNAT family N-acetyltransferase [Oscillospiraceae bacterium]
MKDKLRLFLEIPNVSHEKAYTEMMDRWESLGDKIAPQLLGRHSGKLNGNVTYFRWLEWCEDDRTTGQALSTKIPCTLYFLMNDCGEILGGIVINHSNTHRGHLHAGIAPWNRNKGYGSIMLKLALDKCREMGMRKVDIVPYKGNAGAIKTILKNGGVLQEEFYDKDVCSLRYSIEL